MFPAEVLGAYVLAVIVVVLAPGPDNVLAVSRGLSQGPAAAALSSLGAGFGILFHTVAAALGLAVVLQASPALFWAVKAVGAAYLAWLGYKAITSRSLVSFAPRDRQSLRKVFVTGLMSNVLNPKPGLFVVAFIPQFVSASRGEVSTQVLVFGALFAAVTVVVFTVLGCFASQLARWLAGRPRLVTAINVGAGGTFILAGLSVLALDTRR